MTIAQQERRRERRTSAVNLVDLEVVGVEEVVGRTLDLSPFGMRVELTHALPLGWPVRLRFALGDRLLDVDAVVRSTAEELGEMTSVGLEFTSIDADTREALIAYLETHS